MKIRDIELEFEIIDFEDITELDILAPWDPEHELGFRFEVGVPNAEFIDLGSDHILD